MKDNLVDELLSAWEETYKKGQLTLWIFLALKDGKKYVDEIKLFIEIESKQAMQCEEQSLYRNLRKLHHIGAVAFESGKGHKGPERKYYYLTALGKDLFTKFVERNIQLFFTPNIAKLLTMEETL